MLIIETRIPPILFANILHYLKEEHHVIPHTRSEALRLAITLLSKLVTTTFEDEDSAMEYILSVCGGKLERDKRMDSASKGIMEEGKKRIGLEIDEAVRLFRKQEEEE